MCHGIELTVKLWIMSGQIQCNELIFCSQELTHTRQYRQTAHDCREKGSQYRKVKENQVFIYNSARDGIQNNHALYPLRVQNSEYKSLLLIFGCFMLLA